MINIKHELETQDNRMTEEPMFVVFSMGGGIRVFIEAFFTQKGADLFIKMNSHDLCDPFVFVKSGYNNPEWIEARKKFLSV